MSEQLFSGHAFNRIYKDQILVKLTNSLENHNGYRFKTGLNIDSIPFNPDGECQPGGIYFCQLEDLHLWLNYSDSPIVFVRFVTIPDDALIYTEKNKFKADRLILGNRMKIGDLKVWKDLEYCLAAVKHNGLALRFVKQQTQEICMAAVFNDHRALPFVNKKYLDLAFTKLYGPI